MLTVDPTVAAAAGDFWLLSWLTGSPVLAIIGTVLISLASLVFVGFRLFKVLAPSLLARTPDESVSIAVINRMEPAGMRIDDAQQYRVHMRIYSPDGQDFDTVGTRTFSEHDLKTVYEGNVVPITYNPANPSQVSFHSEARLFDAQQLYGRVRRELGLTDPREAEIFANGVSVTGTVTNSRLTGPIHYGHSELLVTVQFVRADGHAVTRTKSVWLMPTWFNSVDIGSEVTVTYLPCDDSQFIATAGVRAYD